MPGPSRATRQAGTKGLPTSFAPKDRRYALYEDIEYADYWDDPKQFRQDALEKHLVSKTLPTNGRRIIDIGCGFGRLAPCYMDRFTEVVLYDGSLSLLRQASKSVDDRAVLVAGDVGRLPFKPASFDCVLTIRVLQHLDDLSGAVGAIRTILAGDGRLVFSYHNKRNANRILHLVKSLRVASPFKLESAEVSPTLISHHPTLVNSILRDARFSSPAYLGAVVVNPLAEITERLGSSRTPAGTKWAEFMGRHRLAPWLIGSTMALGDAQLRRTGPLADIFECPSCRGELTKRVRAFECSSCDRRYPITDGIFDFRL